MATKKILPLAAMEKILKNSGATRISENAKEALKEALEDIGEDISVDAIRFAHHTGRKTVKGGDIKLAMKSKQVFR